LSRASSRGDVDLEEDAESEALAGVDSAGIEEAEEEEEAAEDEDCGGMMTVLGPLIRERLSASGSASERVSVPLS